MSLPSSAEDEQAVIACCLQDREEFDDARRILPTAAFYDLRLAAIWDAMKAVDDEGEIPGLVSVSVATPVHRLLVMEISMKEVLPKNCQFHVGRILDSYRRRMIIQGCIEVGDAAKEGKPLPELADMIEKTATPVASKVLSGRECCEALVTDLERRFKLDGKLSGIDTGFHKLNELTDGLQFGEQAIIAARPSQGKTAIGLNIFAHAVLQGEVPSLFISLEMSVEAVMRRLMAAVIGIPMNDLRKGSYTPQDFKKFTTFQSRFNKAPAHLVYSPNMTVGDVSATIRRAVRKHGVKLVVVDYLQKITPGAKHEKRTYEVAEVSTRLKAAASSSGVALLTLAQLNRDSEKDKPRAPRLSDLADSSQIERDADMVALIHRDRSDDTGKTALIIAKQRDGELGMIPLSFNGRYCRFESMSRVEQSDIP